MSDTVATIRKAVELGLRTAGIAPEMQQARRLAASAPRPQPAGPRVMILSPRDWAVHVQWEALIGQALRARRADVTMVRCGGGLEVCDRVNVHEGPPPPCGTCDRYTRVALDSHGFRADSFVTERDDEPWPELDELTLPELMQVDHDGLPLGALVDVPVKWFLCSSDLDDDPLAAQTYRRFLRAARRVAGGAVRLLDAHEPDVVVMLNGMFLFEAVTWAAARKRGIRVVTYERAHIDGSLFFTHDAPACHYSVDHLWRDAAARPLTAAEERDLDRYLDDRRRGLRSFVQIWPAPRRDDTRLLESSDGVRRVALFTNVTWDSAALGLDGAFADARSWLVDNVRTLAARPDVRLVVRIHPSEVVLPKWRTREPMADVLRREMGTLPPNVRIVAPDDPLSSYSIMEATDVGLVYTSTAGLELALQGVPVLVGGRPHYRGKGFTLDADDRTAYFDLLDTVLADPAEHEPDVTLARRYAHLFFFDAPIAQPPAHEPLGGLARLDVDDLSDLAPGRNRALDAICDGILQGAPFRSPSRPS